jgi:hypothetical protein
VDLKGGGNGYRVRTNNGLPNELLFVLVASILRSFGNSGRIMLFQSQNRLSHSIDIGNLFRGDHI